MFSCPVFLPELYKSDTAYYFIGLEYSLDNARVAETRCQCYHGLRLALENIQS